MKVNKDFPKINVGQYIDIIDPKRVLLEKVKVIAAWYPIKGERWTEKKELELMGLYGSDPKEEFPQLLLNTPNGALKVFGSDAQDIKKIYD